MRGFMQSMDSDPLQKDIKDKKRSDRNNIYLFHVRKKKKNTLMQSQRIIAEKENIPTENSDKTHTHTHNLKVGK